MGQSNVEVSYSNHIKSPKIMFVVGILISILSLSSTVNAYNLSDYDDYPIYNYTDTTFGDPLFPEDLFTMEQRRDGAVIFHIIGVVYVFVALTIVCNEFFVPCLDVIIEKLGITDDVAGATFMAAGSNAPQLFTSVIGVFISFDDIGLGTIVGSNVFNILFVIGMCALFSRTILTLTWWPLIRDCTFYSITLITLIYFFRDNEIYWWESFILFIIYIAYAVFMKINPLAERCVKKDTTRVRGGTSHATETSMGDYPGSSNNTKSTTAGWNFHHSGDDKMDENVTTSEALNITWPDSLRKRITYLLVAPIVFPLWLTLPDTRTPKGKRWFLLTFIGSIVWIAAYSYLMVWWANIIGETARIPPEVMGLTFLAAGTSIPILINSVIVARKGFGAMAVSSSVGSNIFGVTVGLPVPWLIYGIIYGEPVQVNSVGMVCSISILFMMLLFVILSIACFRWKINKGLGFSMILLYIIFAVFSVLSEFGILPCPL